MKSLFYSDKNMFLTPILYTLSTVVFYALMLSEMDAVYALESFVEVFTIIILFTMAFSVKSGEIKMLKTLYGALLMERVFYALGTFSRMASEEATTIAVVTGLIYLVGYVAFFAVHVIGCEKDKPEKYLVINQVLGLIIATNNVVLLANTTVVVSGAVSFIANAAMEYAMIVYLSYIEKKVIVQ